MVQNGTMQRRQRKREIRRVDLTDVEVASSGTAHAGRPCVTSGNYNPGSAR